MNARVCTCVWVRLSCSTFFLPPCLDSVGLSHANILDCPSSLLVCTSYCDFGRAPCTFSLFNLITKRRTLEGKKSPQHHCEEAMEVWDKLHE